MRTSKRVKAAEVEDPNFTFREVGLLYAVACSSLSQEETVSRAHAQPCGTRGGWQLMTEGLPANVPSNPSTCSDHPETHKHYLFVC